MIRKTIWLAIYLTCLVGCQQAVDHAAGDPAAGPNETHKETISETIHDPPVHEEASGAGDQTYWQACYLQGDKIGYAETSTRRLQEDGRELIETSSHNRIRVKRFGNDIQLDVETTSVETPAGEVLRFESKTISGADPDTISGRREGDQMLLETTIAGKRSSSQMPCGRDVRGFHGVEQSLERAPLLPGQQRRLGLLLPLMSQVVVAQVELAARDLEPTKLLDRTEPLLYIDESMTLPGEKPAPIHSSLWTDRAGRVLKLSPESVAGMEEINYRTTRAVALADTGVARFDLGNDPIVKIDKPLPAPWQTKRVRYRVELDGKDPAELFPASATQQVTSKGPHTAEILVLAPDLAAKTPSGAKPTPQETSPSGMVQSDDPTIAAMAREARGSSKDPLTVARSLEKFVYDKVATKDFSQAFSSALEVARSKQGDCTEHAVLLAALARASGLPSRVAIGLVYVEQKQGFGYHMWTEVYIDGRWLPLDATLGRGGIGASHLKLSDSNLADSGASGESAFTSLLAVMQVIGRLKISVLEAK